MPPPLIVALKSCSCCCRATPPSTRETTSIAPTTALLMKIHCLAYCLFSVAFCHCYFLLIFRSFSNQTPLHLAVDCGHVDVAQLLLSCNAAVDARAIIGCRLYPCGVDENTLHIFCCIVPLIFASDFLFLQQSYPTTARRLSRSR
jgi:hypothetical protein